MWKARAWYRLINCDSVFVLTSSRTSLSVLENLLKNLSGGLKESFLEAMIAIYQGAGAPLAPYAAPRGF